MKPARPGHSTPHPSPAPNALTGFAVCPSGLEEVLAAELATFPGFSQVKTGRGGAHFHANAAGLARANIWARVPTRLLIQVARVSIRQAKDILSQVSRIAWEDWFTHHNTFRIDFSVGREPRLAEPLARNYAALLIKDGICDRFRDKTGQRPSVDTDRPDIRVWAYLDQNDLTLYLDTSGEPLFKRGWRRSKGDAPLRENLAAALIIMTGWDRHAPLADPFCGSGTLLIEAMQIACGLPPGFHPHSPRSFAAEKFRPQSPMGQVNWRVLRQEAQQKIDDAQQLPPKLSMWGSDIDPALIRVAQDNASRALPPAIAAQIEWKAQPFRTAAAPASAGVLVTNPPYGKRLERSGEGFDFERELAETLKKHFAGWQAWILTDNLKFESALRLKSSRRIPVFNGDLDCRWMRFDMVSGSMREPKETHD